MEIADLEHDEQVALVALIEFIGGTNPEITDEESAEIARIVDQIGPNRYREIAAEADTRLADEDGLRSFLLTIRRQEARELVYGAVLSVAVGDTIQRGESALLDWLAKQWKVDLKYDAPEGGGRGWNVIPPCGPGGVRGRVGGLAHARGATGNVDVLR